MIAVGLSFVAALGFGSAAIFARVGMQGISPVPSTLISAISSFFPAAALALFFASPDIRALPAIAFLFFLGHGALTYIGGRVQNHLAINLIGASRSSPFIGSAAIFAAIFATTITGERLNTLIALGTLGVVAGLVVSTGNITQISWQKDRRSILGYLLGLGAAASYGGSNLVAKALSQEYGSPLVVAAFGMLFGVVLLSPIAGRGALEGVRSARTGLGFMALSGLASATAVIALYFALQQADVVVVSPISSVNPLITLLLAHLFLHQLESVTRQLFLGTLLAVAGVVLVVVGSAM